MNIEQQQFLNLQTLPAILDSVQTGWLLGLTETEVKVLASRKLLKPLGNPMHSNSLSFSLVEVATLGADREWLHKACAILQTPIWGTMPFGERRV